VSETISKNSNTSRILVVLTTVFWLLTSPWTLQTFVPEPYFLRTLYQLKIMSTPNGSGQIEYSLSPLFLTIGGEALGLLIIAALCWRLRITAAAMIYLAIVIMMAGMTLLRLANEFRGLH
jgi:hypothetical protein